jgi:hypothetical protein
MGDEQRAEQQSAQANFEARKGVPTMSETILERGDRAASLDTLAKNDTEGTSIVPAGVFGAPAERVFGAQPVAVQRDDAGILQKIKVMAAAAGDDWFYRFPVKNKDGSTAYVEGPSIKCANNVSRLYGNCDVDTRVFDTGTSWMFYARFMDLETGYSLVRPFQQRKSQKAMKTDPGRQEDIVFQIGASKAIRNVICNAIEFFTSFAFEEAKQSIIDRVGKNLDAYREKVKARLDEMKIDLKRVELVRGRAVAQWIASDVALTIAEIQSINDGMSTADDTYPLPAGAEGEKTEGVKQDLGAKLDTLAQNGNGAAAGSGSASSTGGEASQSHTASPGDASPATTQQASPSPSGGTAGQAAAAPDRSAQAGSQTSPAPSGAAAAKADDGKWPKGTEPKTEREYVSYTRHGWFAEIGETITIEEAQAKWKADKTFRNRVGVSEETRDELKAEFDKIIAAAKKKAG